jgi:hypothetical protein
MPTKTDETRVKTPTITAKISMDRHEIGDPIESKSSNQPNTGPIHYLSYFPLKLDLYPAVCYPVSTTTTKQVADVGFIIWPTGKLARYTAMADRPV